MGIIFVQEKKSTKSEFFFNFTIKKMLMLGINNDLSEGVVIEKNMVEL